LRPYCKDTPEIMKNIAALGMCTLQSGLDNVRNATGNPLAGIDPHEAWAGTHRSTFQLSV